MRLRQRRRNSFRWMLTAASPVAALCALVIHPAQAAFEQKNAAILEFGWDTPSSPYLEAQIGVGQQLPFGGIVTDLVQNSPVVGDGNPPDLFGWNVWGSQTLSASHYSNATTALKATDLGRLDDTFLRFNVTPGNVDWFSSSAVVANVTTAAKATLQNGIAGIFLDTEQYQGKPFSYSAQPGAAQHTFAQYQAQARLVGGQFMQSLKAQNPNIQIMLSYGYGTGGTPAQLPTSDYGLLPSFIDGLLDQAGPNNIIYDGYESSYGYTSGSQFQSAYQTMRVSDASASANPTKFASNYRASYGIWVDKSPSGGDSTTWDTQNFSNNYYTPAELNFVTQEAAKRTDKYVWLYSHDSGWWTGNAPQAYRDAVANVYRVGQLERFTGSAKDTTNWEQHIEQSGAITQNNRLQMNAVNAFTASEADYTTKALTLRVGGEVSVEVTNSTSTSNSGLSASALLGLILSNNSGGTTASAMSDSRALMLLWSNANNAILAGVNDSAGSGRFTTISGADHPTGTTYLYQIERLGETSARFSVLNMTLGTPIGTPQVLSFADMPESLSVSLFAQAGNGTFNNVWVASTGWAQDGGGDWNNASNWCSSVPNGAGATAYLGAAITSPRTVYTDSAITLGTLKFDSTIGYQISGQGSLTISSTAGPGSIVALQGSHQINLPITFASDTNINVANAATLTITNPATIKADKTVTESGNVVMTAPVILESGASLVVASGAMSLQSALTMNAGSTVDLRTNSMRISHAGQPDPGEEIRSRLSSGFAGGAWTGNGIGTSSSIAGKTGLGWTDDAAAQQIVVKYAYYGDADLDGSVTSIDFTRLAINFNTPNATWEMGDFNYDGVVNALDFNSLVSNYGESLNVLVAGSFVPEPAALGLFGLAWLFARCPRVRSIR